MPILTSSRGLVTESNELARPDGALSIADNIVIDYDNVIQKRRGFKDYNAADFSQRIKQVFTYKRTLLVYNGTTLSYDISSSGAFGAFSGSYSELISGLRLKGLETNGNFYFTSSTGIKKVSAATSSDIPTSTITNAGGVKAADLSGQLVPDSSGFLPAQSKVAYRMVFGTKDNNQNLILGAPSARVVLTNQSQDANTFEIFTINFLTVGTIANSDYFLFSDKNGGYFVWYNLSGSATAPVNSDTLDRTGIEVNLNGIVTPTATQYASYTANALSSVTSITTELSGTEVQVTLNDPGDAADAAQGSILSTEALVTKVTDGSITVGTSAYAELNFSIPETITTAYFYQLYRTGVVTVSTGVTLNDIDPGDEQQFVFESPITAADITAGEITVTDNTPESFRQSGAYLYTNAITGEGITQANNPPPIAQDMALFRNSTFYANTKDYHRLNLNILSVDNFVSGTTKLSIGQRNSFTEYTFVGVAEVTDITVLAMSGTTSGSYIEINSANDERQYYIWFDTGASTDPAITNKLGIRVPLFLYPDTVAGSKQALLDSLLLVSDFSAVDHATAVVRVTCTDSGNAANAVSSSTWTVNVVTQGDGEDVLAKEVLLSLSSSIGIAIDLTARSLVKVINRDPDSPVTAEYLSSNEDLPGKILLEAKSLEDNTFFVSISDSALSAEFNPELPPKKVISSIATGTNLFTTSTAHGLSVGDKVYVNDNPGLTPVEFSGQYTVLTVPSSTTFTLKNVTVGINQPSIFGVVFKGTAASDNNTSPNRLAFSKISQPEAVPISNFLDVGSKDKVILRILALRDNLFVLKEDGIYIVTGSSAPDFSVRLLDNSAILIAPDSAVVLNNLIYALTTQGVVSISESGVSIVSRPIEDQIKKYTTSQFNYRYTSFGVGYESDRSYLLWLPELKTDTVATQCFRYNSITNTWTRWTITNTCGIVNQLGDDKLYLGLGDRNVLAQERKNLEREDHADRNFTRTIGAGAFNDKQVSLSSTSLITAGDVFTQQQYVSIPKFNRLLSKLDTDSGPADNDYRLTLEQTVGANMGNSLIALVTKLNADPNLFGAFTVPSGSNNIDDLKEDYNTLIDELNNSSSGTSLKDYKEVTDLLTYEVLITDVAKSGNTVTINFSTWFIQGNIEVYKAIKTKVRWAPQHFGKPQDLKQIPEGTLILDQNTIYSGIIAYASDRSADFTEIPFTMSGPGFWVSYPWLDSVWGGNGNDIPLRTLIPQNKSRCRYLTVQFEHINAREEFKLVGISLEPREVSTRGYR
jgi:hypothetical protein